MLWLLGLQDRSIPARTTVALLEQLASAGSPFAIRAFEEYRHSLGSDVWPARDAALRIRVSRKARALAEVSDASGSPAGTLSVVCTVVT